MIRTIIHPFFRLHSSHQLLLEIDGTCCHVLINIHTAVVDFSACAKPLRKKTHHVNSRMNSESNGSEMTFFLRQKILQMISASVLSFRHLFTTCFSLTRTLFCREQALSPVLLCPRQESHSLRHRSLHQKFLVDSVFGRYVYWRGRARCP